ncbi:MAG: nickel-responsive transcriptional regulator NikR [Fibrobacteria bacterium]|nr:nickel-responsive transcriptional regulator NikR [Fibrobacteria bacterium]
MKEKTIRFTISLPENLLQELDDRVINKGYSSRSEFVRDLIRDQMVQDKWASEKSKVIGVLSIIYDHHQRDLLNRLAEAQHSHHLNVLCSTHLHMDHHNCLEIIIIKGNPAAIEKIALEVGGLRGVKFSRLTKAANVDLED